MIRVTDNEFRDWLEEMHDVDERFLFDTPEEAALAAWAGTPSAQARVAEVQHRSETEVVVIIQVDGAPGFHDRDACVCIQHKSGRWHCTSSTGI